MRLTDEMIEEEADYISEFRSGAKFARDYYEKQIGELISSIRELYDYDGETNDLVHKAAINNLLETFEEKEP